jgi:restriction endonuclease Mrr
VTGELDDRERRELRLKARAATLEALKALGGEARREQIRERALADGGFTPRELRAAAPEAVADKFDGLVEHQLSWALTNLKRDGLVENPRWSVWRLAAVVLETPAPATDRAPDPDRLAALRAMPYREYLRTPEWRRTRAAALVRAGSCCSLDVTHTDDLEVHHRTYERLGDELAADLVVLCRTCHRLHHAEHGRPRRAATKRRAQRSLLRRLLAH